ncbi:peroxiredoxin [Actinomycetaceae bacterium MB13-C1-2]|nr:peroxiredoxin [Actinomycetaceae bacterium MB13-C1-2]
MSTENKLGVGDTAPGFTILTTDGELSLDQMLASSDRGVIVYFYPKANTPGCTKEACDFRDNLNSLKGAGYSVIGISADSMSSLEKFKSNQELNFPLGSDPDHSVMLEYGTWGEKKNYGKVFTGIIRSTIVVGKDGKVELANYNVKATGHVARLRKELGVDPE